MHLVGSVLSLPLRVCANKCSFSCWWLYIQMACFSGSNLVTCRSPLTSCFSSWSSKFVRCEVKLLGLWLANHAVPVLVNVVRIQPLTDSSIDQAYFCATIAELSSCNRDHVACRPKILTIPF